MTSKIRKRPEKILHLNSSWRGAFRDRIVVHLRLTRLQSVARKPCSCMRDLKVKTTVSAYTVNLLRVAAIARRNRHAKIVQSESEPQRRGGRGRSHGLRKSRGRTAAHSLQEIACRPFADPFHMAFDDCISLPVTRFTSHKLCSHL